MKVNKNILINFLISFGLYLKENKVDVQNTKEICFHIELFINEVMMSQNKEVDMTEFYDPSLEDLK